MTNAERIRTLQERELAEFLQAVHDNPCEACCNNFDRCRRNNAWEPDCKKHYLEWLRSEAVFLESQTHCKNQVKRLVDAGELRG